MCYPLQSLYTSHLGSGTWLTSLQAWWLGLGPASYPSNIPTSASFCLLPKTWQSAWLWDYILVAPQQVTFQCHRLAEQKPGPDGTQNCETCFIMPYTSRAFRPSPACCLPRHRLSGCFLGHALARRAIWMMRHPGRDDDSVSHHLNAIHLYQSARQIMCLANFQHRS